MILKENNPEEKIKVNFDIIGIRTFFCDLEALKIFFNHASLYTIYSCTIGPSFSSNYRSLMSESLANTTRFPVCDSLITLDTQFLRYIRKSARA